MPELAVLRPDAAIYTSLNGLWVLDLSSLIWHKFGVQNDIWTDLQTSATAPANATEIGGTDVWTKLAIGDGTGTYHVFSVPDSIWTDVSTTSTPPSRPPKVTLKASTHFFMYDNTAGRYVQLGLSLGLWTEANRGTSINL